MKRNITEAFIDILKDIRKNGSLIESRKNKQIEIISKFLQIERPDERVLITPYRNNNIFSLIAETFWVIDGRNDIDFLSRYLERAPLFSEDGKIWSAGYGSRLRNWNGIDQIKKITDILKNDKESKKAVAILYNPEIDLLKSFDTPCNNWLNFLIRKNKLHLNVALRANDAVWGFGGINTFEWSVLQEMISFWTGAEIGNLSWFVGSFEIYERHFKSIEKILYSAKTKTIYDFGIKSPKFSTQFDNLETELTNFFSIEQDLRKGMIKDSEINIVSDELLKQSLEMLKIYNLFLNGKDKIEIIDFILKMELTDFKMAAIEFFSREKNYGKDSFYNYLSKTEKQFFEFYWDK